MGLAGSCHKCITTTGNALVGQDSLPVKLQQLTFLTLHPWGHWDMSVARAVRVAFSITRMDALPEENVLSATSAHLALLNGGARRSGKLSGR